MHSDSDDDELLAELSAIRPNQGDAVGRSLRARLRRSLVDSKGEPFRLGRFTVLSSLGGGGMGSVFVAYDPDLDRKVALKVLHSRGERGRREVLREGRALARLKHPAVVMVYEVGVVDDDVFVAMEYVSGVDLRRWLAPARGSAAILSLLVEAGRGLAAAHDVGIVHLDFKPENVIVDATGRARIIDFGLARTLEELDPTAAATATTAAAAPSSRGGTPGYIAPERLAGGRGDARSDQYSFCVTCWEALTGQRPVRGKASGRAQLSARVVAALDRGMSQDPQARFASMQELLSALAERPGRRRRLAGFVALTTVGLAAGWAWIGSPVDVSSRCASRWEQVEATWNEPRAGAVGEAFAATGLPFAHETWATVRPALDRYAAAWLALHTGSCEDVATRRILPASQFERRLTCLEDRRLHLAALVDRFVAADGKTVTEALAAVDRLPPVAACGEVEPGGAMFAGDPAEVERRLEIRAMVARARADLDTGRPADAGPVIAAALARAREQDIPALLGEVLHLAGNAERLAGRVEPALVYTREALTTAVAHAEPMQAGWAALLLVQLFHLQPEGRTDNSDLLAIAAAFAEQAGSPPPLVLSVLMTRATEELEAGRYTAACEQFERVRELAERHGHRRGVAVALANFGSCRNRLGDYAAAVAAIRAALTEMEAVVGPLHPWTGAVRLNLGSVLIELGEHDAALQEFARVRAIAAANYPDDHPQVAAAHINTAVVHIERGRYADAMVEHEAALAVLERLYGPRHPDVGLTLCNLGKTLHRLGRRDEALVALERAASIHAEALAPDHCHVLTCETDRGHLLEDLGRHAESLALLESMHRAFAGSACPPEAVGELEVRLAGGLWSAGGRQEQTRVSALLAAAERRPIKAESRAALEGLRAAIASAAATTRK